MSWLGTAWRVVVELIEFGRPIYLVNGDGRPYSADEAIVTALTIRDYYDREEYLLAWSEGRWRDCMAIAGQRP